ncbi:YCF48-related protein [Mitsuaria sp. GD03876]|uniref:YCF48-related protein n=1 Tax=Mitsuaria sp. GD03876 TaxID=2975399 RepID=UPI00244959AA|nr:YCF48-related protein [Mitsuaria sp. GD03876]MDH0863005.1 YCF48-related protein [Mitsuaria sp. GD03876]
MGREEYSRAGWAGVLVSAALLSACGGGGSDGGSTQPPAPPPPAQGVAIPDNLAIVAAAKSDVATGTAFTTNLASATGLTFAWSFGDGQTSTDAAPKHDYAKGGEYAVTLKVTNATGTSKEVKFAVTVNNLAHVQGLTCSGAEGSGWCWQAPRPLGTVQYDFSFVDANNGWSVGEQGTILRTTDGGKTWTSQASGVKSTLTAVTFFDASNGWAVGEFGAVLRTTDGGKTWALQPAPSQLGNLTIQADGPGTLLISGYTGTRMTVDGGANWIEGTALQSDPTLGADGVLWQTSYYEGLRKSVDQGRTSTLAVRFENENLVGFNLSGRNLMLLTSTQRYVSGNYVTTYTARRSLDNGQTWDVGTASGLPANGWSYLQALSMTSGADASVVISDTLYRTRDGGSNWTAQPQPSNAYSGVSYSRPARANGVWMRGYYTSSSLSYQNEVSTDSGTTWRALPAEYTGGSLKRQGANAWVARGGQGTTGLSVDGMQTWTRIGGPDADAYKKTLTTAWFFDAKRGLGLNAMGDLLATADGGLNWTTRTAGLAKSLYGYNYADRMQFVDDKKGWLQTSDGVFMLTDDGGATWVTPVQPTRRVQAYQFLDAATGFALMTDVNMSQSQLVMGTVDGGKSWSLLAALSSANAHYTGLQFGTASNGVLYGAGGRMVTTSDGGKNWTGRYFGTGATPRSVAYSDTGTLWASGDGGMLRVSKDDGLTWTAASVSTSSALNAVRFVTPQRGWAVGDNGTVLTTADAGKTWTAQASGAQRSLTQVQFTDVRTGWILGVDGTLLATGTGGQ